jgi:hypothetical protein
MIISVVVSPLADPINQCAPAGLDRGTGERSGCEIHAKKSASIFRPAFAA